MFVKKANSIVSLITDWNLMLLLEFVLYRPCYAGLRKSFVKAFNI